MRNEARGRRQLNEMRALQHTHTHTRLEGDGIHGPLPPFQKPANEKKEREGEHPDSRGRERAEGKGLKTSGGGRKKEERADIPPSPSSPSGHPSILSSYGVASTARKRRRRRRAAERDERARKEERGGAMHACMRTGLSLLLPVSYAAGRCVRPSVPLHAGWRRRSRTSILSRRAFAGCLDLPTASQRANLGLKNPSAAPFGARPSARVEGSGQGICRTATKKENGGRVVEVPRRSLLWRPPIGGWRALSLFSFS